MPDSDSSTAARQERMDSPTRFSIYCNSVELGISPWDIRMALMEILGQREDVVQARGHGTVTMSPAHVRIFLEAVKTTIQRYEDQSGEIDVSRIKELLTSTPTK